MRAFAQSLLLAVCLIWLTPAAADANPQGVYLPPAPTGPGGEDSIETSTGTRCRQSINSNGAYLDMGAVGSAASDLPSNQRSVLNADRDRQALAYARVTVPLGKRPKRINCNSIYEMEIAKLKQELELLRMGAQ